MAREETEVKFPPWLDPDALLAFLDELRAARYNIGTEQYVAAHDLILALTARESTVDAFAFRGLLGPLVCDSPQEQEDFKERYALWLERFGISLSKGAARLEEEERSRKQAEEKIKEVSRKAGWRTWVLIGVGVVALVAIVLALLPSPTPQGEPPGGGVPSPTPPGDIEPSESFFGRTTVIVVSILAVVGAILLWRWWWRREARVFLENQPVDREPELEKIPVSGAGVVDPIVLLHVARVLRRRYEEPSRLLDIDRTVEKTTEAGGWLTPVFGKRGVTPEYLALIERRSSSDQQADLAFRMLKRIAGEGVYIDCYAFDDDPRICFSTDGKNEALTLSELATRYGRRKLIVFSDGACLQDPVTGELAPWTEVFRQWSGRTLLTPEPKEWWGYRERVLGHLMDIQPSALRGLESAAGIVSRVFPGMSDVVESAASSPDVVRDSSRTWVSRHPPESSAIARMVASLRRFLDDAAFFWLSACAVYPALSLNLTLHLGQSLQTTDGNRLLQPSRLKQLLRLPWFRHGGMPDWFRALLVSQLPKERAQQVRDALNALLLSAANPGTDARFFLEVAREKKRSTGWLAGAVLSRFQGKAKPGSPLKDYVFARLMSGRSIAQLAPRVPTAVEEIFGHGAERVSKGRWLVRVYQGLTAILLLGIVSAIFTANGDTVFFLLMGAVGFALLFSIVSFMRKSAELFLFTQLDLSLLTFSVMLVAVMEEWITGNAPTILGTALCLILLLLRLPAVKGGLIKRFRSQHTIRYLTARVRTLLGLSSGATVMMAYLVLRSQFPEYKTVGGAGLLLVAISSCLAITGLKHSAGRWPLITSSLCTSFALAAIPIIEVAGSTSLIMKACIGVLGAVHVVAVIFPRAWPFRDFPPVAPSVFDELQTDIPPAPRWLTYVSWARQLALVLCLLAMCGYGATLVGENTLILTVAATLGSTTISGFIGARFRRLRMSLIAVMDWGLLPLTFLVFLGAVVLFEVSEEKFWILGAAAATAALFLAHLIGGQRKFLIPYPLPSDLTTWRTPAALTTLWLGSAVALSPAVFGDGAIFVSIPATLALGALSVRWCWSEGGDVRMLLGSATLVSYTGVCIAAALLELGDSMVFIIGFLYVTAGALAATLLRKRHRRAAKRHPTIEMAVLLITIVGTLVLMPVLNHFKPQGGYHALQFAALSSSPDLTPPYGTELESFLFGVKLDFLFLLCYPVALFLLCRRASQANADSRWFSRLGRFLSYVALSAIPSDVIDNYTVLKFLDGTGSSELLALGGVFTIWNFAVFGGCALYLLAALGSWVVRRRRAHAMAV